MSYSHQQWEPVVLRKPGAAPKPAGPKKTGGGGGGGDKIVVKVVGREFGQALVAARTAKNLTRKQLADQARVPLNTLADYEAGNGKPDQQVIQRVQRVLGVTLPKSAPKTVIDVSQDD